MAAINQRIPNFLGGVSQQPDKIKFPGQLRVCDNAVPDVTFGLRKRPPAEFVGTLSQATATGHWYNIIRDGDEKYIVQITPHQTLIDIIEKEGGLSREKAESYLADMQQNKRYQRDVY